MASERKYNTGVRVGALLSAALRLCIFYAVEVIHFYSGVGEYAVSL